jgi:type IV pilus assembly protein PilP
MKTLTKLFAVAALALAAVQAQAGAVLPDGRCSSLVWAKCGDFHLWATIGPLSVDDELARSDRLWLYRQPDTSKREPSARWRSPQAQAGNCPRGVETGPAPGCFNLWVTIGPSADVDTPKREPGWRSPFAPGADDGLARFIENTKHEPGARVEPLPEVKPHETAVYSGAKWRSPFVPGPQPRDAAGNEGTRPREFLEWFPLDTLKMVGTLKVSGKLYGLVQTKDARVFRVSVGDYIGQYEGKITEITPPKITLVQWSDAFHGWGPDRWR